MPPSVPSVLDPPSLPNGAHTHNTHTRRVRALACAATSVIRSGPRALSGSTRLWGGHKALLCLDSQSLVSRASASGLAAEHEALLTSHPMIWALESPRANSDAAAVCRRKRPTAFCVFWPSSPNDLETAPLYACYPPLPTSVQPAVLPPVAQTNASSTIIVNRLSFSCVCVCFSVYSCMYACMLP